MTVQQCKYVLEIAKTGSLNEAAKVLFIAQSSLSSAIKQLERELGIRIFERTNRGVVLTEEGAEFVRYAGQLAEQSDLVTQRYQEKTAVEKLAISAQHYDFIADLFCRLLGEMQAKNYYFSLRETKTSEVIREVESSMSDIGILAVREEDRALMERYLGGKELSFTEFLVTSPYVFLKADHKLASAARLSQEALKPYPYLLYDQGVSAASFFREELITEPPRERCVEISDRATLMNVLLSSDCYTVGTGIMPSRLNAGKIVAIPLESTERYCIGYILNENRKQKELTRKFVGLLHEFAKGQE